MRKNLSSRIHYIEASKSVELARKVAELQSRGEDLIGLHIGECDIAPHPKILQAMKESIEKGQTKYDLVQGILSLREAIAEREQRNYGVKTVPDHLCIGAGSKQVLYNIFQMILDPGDEVIIPIPYWVSFPESVKLAGGVPVFASCHKNNQLDLERIQSLVSSKTKAIIVNSPNNPSGAVYPREDLLDLIGLCEKNDLFLISDEAYEDFTYGESSHIPPRSLSSYSKILTARSFSKSYSMTGFRIGYLLADLEYISSYLSLQSHLMGNLPVFIQKAAEEALRVGNTELVSELSRRQELAYGLFSSLFSCEPPQGAMYLYLDTSDQQESSLEIAIRILEKAKVALLPGEAFGQEHALRLSFASSASRFEEAFERIKRVL